ncbi:MAG: hypothetical protein AUK44_07515 [Porphyromonadaceae bacterium CG2_30_38_12]|nr:MAG: hypothetical protein AUK44_07515 [Porphyromonadaceae bacterium CG2_30_38_12]
MPIMSNKWNNFWVGFFLSLWIPPAFIYVYLAQFSPFETNFVATIQHLYPSELLGKLLLLSAFPNLALVFLFYKTDSFKLSQGILIAAMPYFIASFFML